MRRPPGPLLIVSATILWGTTGTAQELAPEAATPLTVGSLRLLIGAATLFLVAAAGGHLSRLSGMRRPATFVAAIGIAAYQPFFFLAVDRTGVVLGTIVAIGSAPVVAGLLAWGYDRVPPSRRWVGATGTALAGVALLVAAGRDIGISADGVLFAVAAGTAYAFYVIAARQFSREGNVVGSTAVFFGIAAVLLLPLLGTDDLDWIAERSGWIAMLHLGILATAAAYLLFASGLKTTRSTTATTLSLGEPATAAMLGVIVIGERPPLLGWIGFALLLLALLVIATEGRSHRLAPRRSPPV
ncbi:MAG: DMT family transporter [Acidimicrobiia bacterium]|nr:DMT family transporter [Acidimicrobiia bacterium]